MLDESLPTNNYQFNQDFETAINEIRKAGEIKLDMVDIEFFTVSRENRQKTELPLDVDIRPQDGKYFSFLNEAEYEKFKDQLRQTFELFFVFGCHVTSTKMTNKKTTQNG